MSADPLLQIVDDSDNILFDLNDATGANNPFGLKTELVGDGFNYNAPRRDLLYFEGDLYDGGITAKKRNGLTESSWRMVAEATSYDNLRDGLGELAKLLDRSGQIKIQFEGQTSARYIDYLDSLIPAAFRGQDRGLFYLQKLLKDPDGVPVVIMRQPAVRRSRVSSSQNLATRTLIRGLGSTPDGWSETDAAGILSGFDLIRDAFRMSVTGTNAASYIGTVTPITVGASCCVQIDARVVSGNGYAYVDVVDATGGASSASSQVSSKRWTRLTIPRTLAAGTQVHIRLKGSNGGAGTTVVEFRMLDVKTGLTPTPRVAPSKSVFTDLDRIPPDGARSFEIWNDGDAPAPIVLELGHGAGALDILLAARPVDLDEAWDAADWHNLGLAHQVEDSNTVGSDATEAAAGTNSATGTGGNDVVDSPALTGSYAVVLANAITSGLDSKRGSFDVFLRMRKTVATDEIWLYLESWTSNYGIAGTGGSAKVHTPVEFPAQAANAEYSDVYLGTIDVPEDETLSAIQLRVYAKRVSGSGALRFDQYVFVPRWFSTRLVNGVGAVAGDVTVFDSETRRHKVRRADGTFYRYTTSSGPTALIVPPGVTLAYVTGIRTTGTDERTRNSDSIAVAQSYQAREWV